MGFISLIRGIFLNCCFALCLLFKVSEGRKPSTEDAQQSSLEFNPLCQSDIAREEQRIYFTSSGGVFSYTLCSFRGTTFTMKCFAYILPLFLCGTPLQTQD